MDQLRAVILHRHLLFRDLIEFELRELGPVTIAGTTQDPEQALELAVEHDCGALVIESEAGFLDRHEMLALFARLAEALPGFVLVAANLATSEIEIVQDSVSRSANMGALRPLLHGVPSLRSQSLHIEVSRAIPIGIVCRSSECKLTASTSRA